MAKFVPQERYRMVDLGTGQVVMVFQSYPGMSPLDSCRRAWEELGIKIDAGHYRLDCLRQSRETKRFRWSKVYHFSLELR